MTSAFEVYVVAQGGRRPYSQMSLVERAQMDAALRQQRACEELEWQGQLLVRRWWSCRHRPLAHPPGEGQLCDRTMLHRVGTCLVAECPPSGERLEFPDWRGPAALGWLASTRRLQDSPWEWLAGLWTWLAESHLLDSQPSEWEFHDLYFHFRSRRGDHRLPVGGLPSWSPPPAPSLPDGLMPLPPPATESGEDFLSLLGRRRSVRSSSGRLNLNRLSDFLFHSTQNCPSGGGLREIQIHLVVHDCPGLESGIYRYWNPPHALQQLPSNPKLQAELLQQIETSQGHPAGVWLGLLADLQKVRKKYKGLSYALSLKNAGCLMQNQYLVATWLGLAPCALGTGDNAVLENLFETSPETHAWVSEFILR